MNYNLQGKAWEGASDLPEVNWRLGNPRIAKKGTPNGRAYMFAALFLLASSRMPTRTSPHRPISAPQSVQVTMLSLVEWAGTVSLLLPHLRHLRGQVCVSALIGADMTLRPFWSVELPQWRRLNGASLFSKRPLSRRIAARLAGICH